MRIYAHEEYAMIATGGDTFRRVPVRTLRLRDARTMEQINYVLWFDSLTHEVATLVELGKPVRVDVQVREFDLYTHEHGLLWSTVDRTPEPAIVKFLGGEVL